MKSSVLPVAKTWTDMPKETSLPQPPPSSSPPADTVAQEGQPSHQPQLELFHKLGYSTEQVLGVLRAFGPVLDTDKLLERLVKEQGVRLNVPISQWDVRAEKGALLLPVERGSEGLDESSGEEDEDPLRPIVIDGSNVAMSHGNKDVFSCLGIQLAVNYFLERGHKSITVFVPSWRSEKPRPDVPISDQHILRELERRKLLVFTPSKRVGGKRIVCHDDRYIVRLAYETDGLIVSNDQYRDLQRENPDWKRFIEERVIMYSFVNNKFMPPDDPMGRHGPSLDDLRRKCPVVQKKQPCPYGKKCTFGIKCRFLHPERPKQSNQTLADELRSRCSLPHTTTTSYTSPTSSPPGNSLSLVEDMAKKLTLGSPLKKEHSSESKAHSHGKKSCSKKDRKSRPISLEHMSVSGGDPQERQLDSGLGSIDQQPEIYDNSRGSGVYLQSLSSLHGGHLPTHHYGFHNQHCMARSDTNMAYNLNPYSSYRPYSGEAQTYSHPHHLHRPPQPMFYSDPYVGGHRGAHGPTEKVSYWEQSQANTGQAKDQRKDVRKKLMAIFSVQLVDMAMDMNPDILDSQRLAAAILELKNQGL